MAGRAQNQPNQTRLRNPHRNPQRRRRNVHHPRPHNRAQSLRRGLLQQTPHREKPKNIILRHAPRSRRFKRSIHRRLHRLAGINVRRQSPGKIRSFPTSKPRPTQRHLGGRKFRVPINRLDSSPLHASKSDMDAARVQRESRRGGEGGEGGVYAAEGSVELSAEEDGGEAAGLAGGAGGVLRFAQHLRDERGGIGAGVEVRSLRR